MEISDLMKNAYYLIASLPALRWGSAPPMTVRNFIERCTENLSAKERQILEDLSLCPEDEAHETSTVAGKWTDWETFLRNRLAAARAKAKGGAGERRPRGEKGFHSDAERTAQGAFSSANPIEKERMLDLARWKALEDFAAPHQFDFDVLAAYKLKLELLWRHAAMDRATGWKNFKELGEKILKKEELI